MGESSGSESGGYGILGLNETACSAYKQSGSANLAVMGGGIMVNSNCSKALKKSGSGNLTAGVINYFEQGGYKITGSGSVPPTPSPVDDRVEDPLELLFAKGELGEFAYPEYQRLQSWLGY